MSVSSGETRRNHLRLRERANSSDPDAVVRHDNSSRQIQTRTKTGTCIRPPNR